MTTKTLHKRSKESLSEVRRKHAEILDKLEGEDYEKEVSRRLNKLEETLKRYSKTRSKTVKRKSYNKMSFFERQVADDKYLAECSDEKFNKEMQRGEDQFKKVFSN